MDAGSPAAPLIKPSGNLVTQRGTTGWELPSHRERLVHIQIRSLVAQAVIILLTAGGSPCIYVPPQHLRLRDRTSCRVSRNIPHRRR
jgi:hypothetical protein